jgi:D-aspartate ligase
LLDVNPRLGASFRLFVAHNGMDVVRAQYLHLTGQPVPLSRIRIGRKWIVEDADIVSSFQYFRDRAVGFREWISSYGGLQEGAWFACDDLLPFFHVAARFISRKIKNPFLQKTRRSRHPVCQPSMQV